MMIYTFDIEFGCFRLDSKAKEKNSDIDAASLIILIG